MIGGFIFMCAFISSLAVAAVIYFNHEDKMEEKKRQEMKRQ